MCRFYVLEIFLVLFSFQRISSFDIQLHADKLLYWYIHRINQEYWTKDVLHINVDMYGCIHACYHSYSNIFILYYTLTLLFSLGLYLVPFHLFIYRIVHAVHLLLRGLLWLHLRFWLGKDSADFWYLVSFRFDVWKYSFVLSILHTILAKYARLIYIISVR